MDFAYIELDRPVFGREPLKVRTRGKIKKNDKVFVVGHPTGLPVKVAGDSYVQTISNNIYFQANLDTFGGNSGSAVLSEVTGLVEGILVRGDQDYVYEDGCKVPKVCTMSSCRGEEVTRITGVQALMDHLKKK